MAKEQWFRLFGSPEYNSFLPENRAKTLRFGNREICLVRNSNGYFALHNYCPHAGGELGRGRCDSRGRLVCPLHGYRFDPETGREPNVSEFTVRTYRIEEREGAWGVWL